MNKISIAIIDDESLVRLGIKSSVEWENYGYEIIGEADNGQNGLEMIQSERKERIRRRRKKKRNGAAARGTAGCSAWLPKEQRRTDIQFR